MDDKIIFSFENKRIRTAWNEEEQEWYFSIVDVVGMLTDSPNPTDHLKKMRKRDLILGNYIGTHCPQVEMSGESGKKRKALAGNTEHLLNIIQFIPSQKTESFKLWLTSIGRDRTIDKNTGPLMPQIDDTGFYKQVSDLLATARKHAKRQLDTTITATYYEIG
ncbi:MAG: hypothetical protein LBV40_04945, partial [Methanomicrobiales archaeon]|nr:hypothetical protein [Methanomicrobiales archaeon]